MSWDRIEKDWSLFEKRAKTRWDKLTDSDWEGVSGSRDALAERIRLRYGVEKDRADREIEEWMKEPGVLDDWNDRRPILDM
jgi:uncharacterized protein YjbJ (UPF0337 family)